MVLATRVRNVCCDANRRLRSPRKAIPPAPRNEAEKNDIRYNKSLGCEAGAPRCMSKAKPRSSKPKHRKQEKRRLQRYAAAKAMKKSRNQAGRSSVEI